MTLADAIIAEEFMRVSELLRRGEDANQIDEYGFTPLIEAAIVDNIEIGKLLLEFGAQVNFPDMTGNIALNWTVENNNYEFSRLLLDHGADPNAYSVSGQPVLTKALLRHQKKLKNLLIARGAQLDFAQDYINTKLLGHIFELVGIAHIVSPRNNFVEVDFEGFYLEVSLGLIANSLAHYKNHFAGRSMRRFGRLNHIMINVMDRAARLIQFQQYRVNLKEHYSEIENLLKQEPLLIPVAYEGHAITFVKYGPLLVKCDRREDSRLFDNIYIYEIRKPRVWDVSLVMNLMYEKQSYDSINVNLPIILDLKPVTEIKIPAQISGNCSWANVEACIPTLHFLLSSHQPDFQENIAHYKTVAINYFNQWREWNKTRALDFCIQSLAHIDSIRRKCKAEILGAILFQSLNVTEVLDRGRWELILRLLLEPEYRYILDNYVQAYCYEDIGEEGKNFFKVLKEYGYIPQRR